MNLSDLITEFLEYLQIERNVSPLTIRNYKHYLDRFRLWWEASSPTPAAGEVGAQSVDKINQDIIRRYRVFLARYADAHNLTLARATQNYHLIALRTFLRYLTKKDIKTLSPDKIDLGKVESKSLKFLNREQLGRLFSQPDTTIVFGLRDRAILELLFSTGLRVSELVKLNRNSIDLKSREIGIIGKQIRNLGIKTPLTSIESFGLTTDASPFEGQWFVDATVPTDKFSSGYQAKYGKAPGPAAANTYDAIHLLVQAFEATSGNGKPSSDKVVKELSNIKDYSGALGSIVAGPDGAFISQATVKVIKNGQAVSAE